VLGEVLAHSDIKLKQKHGNLEWGMTTQNTVEYNEEVKKNLDDELREAREQLE